MAFLFFNFVFFKTFGALSIFYSVSQPVSIVDKVLADGLFGTCDVGSIAGTVRPSADCSASLVVCGKCHGFVVAILIQLVADIFCSELNVDMRVK